nr:MAG TPA: hypothetical protein [Caudoviricetes sp.]
MSVIGDNAARWGAWLTSDLYDLGYSQPRRWSLASVREGGSADADCSSLVAHCWNQGGAHPAFPADDGTWTGTLRELAAARGFSVMPYTAIGGDPANLMAGDALLSERASGGVGHVALHIGGGVLAEAWVDSHGSDGWDDPDEPVGDQTGQETRQIAYTDHPYTSAGLWTHVLRPPASGGGGSASKGGGGPLLGIDVSNWQAGIDIAAVNPCFVIVQVTRGLEGINQYWREQATATRDLGLPVGLYHYVEGGGAAAEAARFIDEIAGWVGAAMICVDWESDDNAAWGDTDYLRRLITALKQRISGPVVLYGMASSYPWDIAREHGCGTWVAQYADAEPTGWDPAPWSDGTWEADMHQYTGTGRVPGWDGDLDLNVLPGGTDAWARLTGSPTTTTTTTTTIGRTKDMILIETRTPWGDTAWALITQSAGAAALGAQQAQAYNAALGRCGTVPWDHYQLLVREAWERHAAQVAALGGTVRESVDAATTRVIAAVTARPAADTTTL